MTFLAYLKGGEGREDKVGFVAEDEGKKTDWRNWREESEVSVRHALRIQDGEKVHSVFFIRDTVKF